MEISPSLELHHCFWAKSETCARIKPHKVGMYVLYVCRRSSWLTDEVQMSGLSTQKGAKNSIGFYEHTQIIIAIRFFSYSWIYGIVTTTFCHASMYRFLIQSCLQSSRRGKIKKPPLNAYPIPTVAHVCNMILGNGLTASSLAHTTFSGELS
jgi:hypothetical protein